MNIAKFLRTALFIEHQWWLRLVQSNFRKIETNVDIPFSLFQKCTDGIVQKGMNELVFQVDPILIFPLLSLTNIKQSPIPLKLQTTALLMLS